MVARRTSGVTTKYPEFVVMPPRERKHKSPVKRLVDHKNSVHKHKEKISRTINTGRYSQYYGIAPGNSYVIEPQGGELPYELAEKRPK